MKIRPFASVLAVAVAVAAVSPSLAAGDPERGAKVFRKCQACHQIDKEQNKVGPHLVKIINRPVAHVEGFNYSTALKKAGEDGLVWTEENLDKYLENPKDFIPGNRMAFAGLKDAQERQDVIAYMREKAGVWGE